MALLNNYIEIRIDAWKLCQVRGQKLCKLVDVEVVQQKPRQSRCLA